LQPETGHRRLTLLVIDASEIVEAWPATIMFQTIEITTDPPESILLRCDGPAGRRGAARHEEKAIAMLGPLSS
jgi:hypothetical protein